MNQTGSAARSFRFSVFEADLRASELRKNGVKIKLQDQPFQILAMLLENPGELVSREELRQRLWPADTFVDFDHSLNSAVKKLRQALVELAEEGVVQLFRPRDGAAPMVGVVGVLQLDVLKARLAAEYGVAIGFEQSTYNLARWISSPDREALTKFIDENRSAICDDVDGDPVFLATSAFMMRRAEELAPKLTFRDIKDVRVEQVAA